MTHFTRTVLLIAALALVAAACGDSAETTTTTTEVSAVAGTQAPADTTPTTSPPPTAAPTTPPPATAAPATTTTAAPTTTSAAVALDDPTEIVEAKTAAVIAALPEGWTFADDPDQEEDGDDFIFSECLDEDSFDLDLLDDVTAAVKETDIEGPADGSPFGGPMADIEARVFDDEATAIFAFATLQDTVGTEEGRDCLAVSVAEAFLSDSPVPVDEEPIVEVT